MFELNGTYLIFIASFLVFIGLLDAIMLKPVGKVIRDRQARIQDDLDAARRAREQAASLVDKYQEHVSEIRSRAHDALTQASTQAARKKSEELASVQKEGQARLEAAKAELAAEREALIDELVVHERELVEAITQKVIGEPVAVTLDAGKVRRTLEEAC